jgi:glycosyltransferase involved in cell wall biosynthesis
MTENKGIFDLPAIDRKLAEAGVSVVWTLAGDGPGRPELKRQWDAPHVQFVTPETNDLLLALAAQHDVFVLPTRFEGFPVSLLEAMAAGLVPVVTNLPGGISEVVHENVTGYKLAAFDVNAFAQAILELDSNRDRVSEMGRRARALVSEKFDIRERVNDYQSLFARWRELRRNRPKDLVLPYGSRLDKRWIPNGVVRLFRYGSRRFHGKPVVW